MDDYQKLFRERFGVEPGQETTEASLPAPLLGQILQRRTHRSYSDKPVPDALIDMLLAAALSASSKSDFQQASVIKLKDPQKRKAIADSLPQQPWIGASPVFLIFCGDPRRLEE